MPGGGTAGSGTSTSAPYSIWGGGAWCAGCRSWLTLTSCVTSASPPSTDVLPSPSRRGIGRTSRSNSYRATCAATPGGRRYILLLVDDATRYMWTAFLADKSSTQESIKKIQAAVENNCGRKLRVFRTDNGGEFTSASFAESFACQGVERHHSTPHTLQQNGVVERHN
jgi:transposase InsO family protein